MAKLTALVAGAGPVGLTMAAELARRGISCRIVEKEQARTELSKALVVWPRTLELLRFAGAEGGFLETGRKITSARLYAGKRRLATIGFESITTPYPFALFVPQSETERLLEENLARLGVKVERGVELTNFTSGADGVTARLRRADGKTESVDADYLLGCDGAHSTVRHKLGFAFDGVSEQGVWMLGDVKLRNHPDPGELLLFWHGAGVLAIFPMREGRYRIIADWGSGLQPGKNVPATLAQIQMFVDQRGPGGMVAFDPTWLSFFAINERKVKDYRKGRVFLLGDAAHIHSPAGGQGMNTGMQDAFNLGWKLALAATGKAPEALLDSYASERGDVGAMVLRNATRLTHIATIRNRPARAARNLAAWLLMKLPKFRRAFAAVMTELNIAYPESALSRKGKGAPKSGLRPGDRAPDADLVLLGGGRARIFDALDPGGFTFLSAGADESAGRALARRFAPYVKYLPCLPGGDYANGFYLIRPDGYLGLIAGNGEYKAVEKYLGTWLRA
jgi:2-polyprenyl-6-methoxyphenol hydroxylase-like FAD-dependent oxidoreductase